MVIARGEFYRLLGGRRIGGKEVKIPFPFNMLQDSPPSGGHKDGEIKSKTETNKQKPDTR